MSDVAKEDVPPAWLLELAVSVSARGRTSVQTSRQLEPQCGLMSVLVCVLVYVRTGTEWDAMCVCLVCLVCLSVCLSVHELASRKVKAIDKRIEKIEASLSSPSLSPAQRLQLGAERDEVCMFACFSASPPALGALCVCVWGAGGRGLSAGERDVERKREEAGERL
jgi:hypothetical protein